MNRDKIACNCHNVSYGKIIDAVKNGADSFEKVCDATGAGSGFAHCREFIESMIQDIKRFPEDYK